MKNTLKKIVALMLVFTFVFAFAACNDDNEETTAAATTTMEETTAASTTAAGETTTVAGETTTAAATVPGETTTAVAFTMPIGGTPAQVIEFYNQYGNAMKSFKGKVTVTKKDGTVSTINHVAGGSVVKNIALGLLPNDYTDKPTYTFVNGTSTADNKNLSKWLPRDDSSKLSELSTTGANGVKSATCTASGTGCKIVIAMSDDKTTGATALSDKPKYVSKCMDTLNLKAEDLEPFTLESAVVNYSGCTIEAAFDEQGRMTKLDIVTPAQIMGNLKYGLIQLKDTDVVGDYKAHYTFVY